MILGGTGPISNGNLVRRRMGFYESFLRRALFSLDPESAHNVALWAVSSGLVSVGDVPRRPVTAMGLNFDNPVGLAAGFDKNGVALDQWHRLGFGFVEVGTVTRHAQPGNPKPRLFRLPESRALINRMGFNNAGADDMARRFESGRPQIPVGINIGKSKVTPIEEAESDYAYSYARLAPLADYIAVNVSSPNTPGLRGLQDREPLRRILGALRDQPVQRPILVKISPDLEDGGLEDIAKVVEELDLAGVIATNTTLSRSGLAQDPGQDGGLSGAPLTQRSDDVVGRLRNLLGTGRTLVGVGGVMSLDDARRKLQLGADLIQVYTGWVYGGPSFVREIVTALDAA